MKNGLRFMHRRVARTRGFTLIELMITVVIIGILAAFAYPSYQEQVRKSRRADGKGALLQAAQVLERCYTRSATFAGCAGIPAASPENFYAIDVDADAATFTVQAVPQGAQADDADCGTLQVTHTGALGSQGAAGDANECW